MVTDVISPLQSEVTDNTDFDEDLPNHYNEHAGNNTKDTMKIDEAPHSK